mgnify:CR=1 FL=1
MVRVGVRDGWPAAAARSSSSAPASSLPSLPSLPSASPGRHATVEASACSVPSHSINVSRRPSVRFLVLTPPSALVTAAKSPPARRPAPFGYQSSSYSDTPWPPCTCWTFQWRYC